ncbi:matrixin family metalloprotease [Trichothermofontia sp.]
MSDLLLPVSPLRCLCSLCRLANASEGVSLVPDAMRRRQAQQGSGDAAIDALLGRQFNGEVARQAVGPGGTITFSFVTAATADTYPAAEDETNIREVNGRIKENVRGILRSTFGSVLPLTFVEVPDSPASQIRIMFSDGPGPTGNAYSYYPGTPGVGGSIHLQANNEQDEITAYSSGPGSFGYVTLIHELGHALGLKHPGNYNAIADKDSTSEPPFLSFDLDNTRNTVMSYNPEDLTDLEPSTLMAYDIRALQFLYSARTDFASGDTVYRFAGDNFLSTIQTIWDGGGIDTLDFTALPGGDYVFDMRPGGLLTSRSAVAAIAYQAISDPSEATYRTFSSGQVIAFNVTLENLLGSPSRDEITGNDATNLIAGGQGDDTIIGNRGSDTLRGGKGNDLIRGGKGLDVMFGDDGDDTLWGDRGTDTLTGGAGNDLFVLEAGRGPDTITDFQPGSDRLGLANGLQFDQLRVTGIEGGTVLQLASSGEDIARLLGIAPDGISSANFTLV